MKTLTLACASLVLTFSAPAFAEKADREKPAMFEGAQLTVNEATRQRTLEGDVQLTQGTLVIKTDKLVYQEDADGYEHGTAYGGPGGLAHFRQKREGKDEYVEGYAERIEHYGKTEKSELFGRAMIRVGQDEIRGQYIAYDGLAETYVVTSGPNGTSAAGTGGRVRGIIQPKNKPGASSANALAAPASNSAPSKAAEKESSRLKPAPEITTPKTSP